MQILNNLFTIFDPMIFNLPLNYFMMMILIILFMKKNFWLNNSNFKLFFNKILLNNIIKNNPIMNKSIINLFLSLFIFLMLINLMNLIPNIFFISTNISFTLNFSFWLINNFFMFNMNLNMNIFFMNLTPKNTPIFLIPLINLIELNSFFIQILTLSLRLMINMMLGHIIINLMNNFILINFYLMIEFLIIIIQSYVFFILNLLNSNNMY